jgi:hypothetical protein
MTADCSMFIPCDKYSPAFRRGNSGNCRHVKMLKRSSWKEGTNLHTHYKQTLLYKQVLAALICIYILSLSKDAMLTF